MSKIYGDARRRFRKNIETTFPKDKKITRGLKPKLAKTKINKKLTQTRIKKLNFNKDSSTNQSKIYF
jgi:hypothetical protein